jgi:acyl-CoA dehydrogenase
MARIDVGALAEPVQLGTAELAASLLDRAAVLISAELLGLAARMLDVSVDYAKTREQFGRPIGSFQAVKNRLADMHVDVEGMRSSAYYAAWAVQTGAPGAALAASTAKSWCGDAGRRVVASALQVHGGIGFTWEHDLHLYLKRAEVDARLYGDPAWHRARLIRLLRDRVAAGESAF